MGARLGRRAGPEAGSEAGAVAGCRPAPYERRVRWLREIQSTLRERRPERARQLLRLLRQDLGLEGSLLTDILYRDVAFLNLVDPISHDLLMNLARELQCPKKDYELWKSSEKICRQLIYHLTPHSKQQQGSSLCQRKTQSWLLSLVSGGTAWLPSPSPPATLPQPQGQPPEDSTGRGDCGPLRHPTVGTGRAAHHTLSEQPRCCAGGAGPELHRAE
ncbi:leucine-rich repeat-containing protein 75B isoform X3 [Macaca fascicularis]|uniref:leucine-rich repeat-containing protein 75B isoform X3 n=1 Tax=Macaca fascicularis TaxID=9541 RepID=UPI003D15497B